MRAVFLLLGSGVLLAPMSGAMAQRAAAPADPGTFSVLPWVSISPDDLTPESDRRALDLTTPSDPGDIYVFAPRRPQAPLDSRGGTTPAEADLLVPRNLPIEPPTTCPNGAYDTVGGQPANGEDLVGGLGARGC